MISTLINTKKFFRIKYLTMSGKIENYILRTGVMNWKGMNGEPCQIKGTGRSNDPNEYLTAYCANRKNYRSFVIGNIIEVKQGEVNVNLWNASNTK